MLHFESLFWKTSSPEELIKKLESLGFKTSASLREPAAQSIYFGPESLEIITSNDLATISLNNSSQGVVGIALESMDLASEFKRLSTADFKPQTPKCASFVGDEVPIWYGFSLADSSTPALSPWIFSNSPEVLERQKQQTLPISHANTCFGVEGVHVASQNPEADAKAWKEVLGKNDTGLKWTEGSQALGRRFLLGERFLDFIQLKNAQGAFMLTLKVTDLEKAKDLAKKAGAPVTPCHNRDGFIISGEWTSGPALRMVRAFWKRYTPRVSDYYPHGRRNDAFRPLGGTHTTTLVEGFTDNWKH